MTPSASINGSSDLGTDLGANMARFVDHAEGKWLASMGWIPVRCRSCAFTAGTFPNRSLGTMANATKCVMEGEPFYCHHNKAADGMPQRVCAGWMMLNSERRAKAPWDYIPAATKRSQR